MLPSLRESSDPPCSSLIIDLIRASRPAGWLIAAGIYRIGFAYSGAAETRRTLSLTLALTFPFCLYLFGLNDLHDVASDAHNLRKGGFLHGARLDAAGMERIRAGVALGGITMLAFVPFLSRAAGDILLGVLAVGWIYSRPVSIRLGGRVVTRVRLKEIPLVDGLASAAIISGILALGFVEGARLEEIPIEPFAFVPAIVGLHVFASVMDVESDEKAGHRTLPVRIGPRATTAVSLALSTLTALTVPLVDFAPGIAVVAWIQVIIIASSLGAPWLITPQRGFVAIGAASGLGMAHLIFIYLR